MIYLPNPLRTGICSRSYPLENAWLMQQSSIVFGTEPTAPRSLLEACLEEHGHGNVEPILLEEAIYLMGASTHGR